MKILQLLRKRSKFHTDKQWFKLLGKGAYIRNGRGYGFVSNQEIYDNNYIKLGLGLSTYSGYGDWGGGFSHASTHPLFIVLNDKFEIISAESDGFYNGDHSKKMRRLVDKNLHRITVGEVFKVTDPTLKRCLDKAFNVKDKERCMSVSIDFTDEKHSLFMIED